MSTQPSSFGRLAQLLRKAGLWAGLDHSGLGIASRIERRLLMLLAEQVASATYATASVLVMAMLVAPYLANASWLLAILILRSVALAHNITFAGLLRRQLSEGMHDRRTVNQVIYGAATSAFLWGAITWPLEVGRNLEFMAFLIVVIALCSIALSVISASYERRAMISVSVGGALGLAPKIALLTPAIGWILPLGFVIWVATITGYAHLVSRQALGGVLIQMRNQRISARLGKANAALQEALDRAQWLADRDGLTELRNRRAFEAELPPLTSQFAHRSFGLMLIDLDHFKIINDRFGHGTGDGVLIAVGTALRQWEREATGRIVGRWGGEEFIVMASLRPWESLADCAENLRRRIEALGQELHWPGTVSLSASIGCAGFQEGAEFEAALTCADAALYEAKRAGRNCWKLAA